MFNKVLWVNFNVLYKFKYNFFFFEEYGRYGGRVVLGFFFLYFVRD